MKHPPPPHPSRSLHRRRAWLLLGATLLAGVGVTGRMEAVRWFATARVVAGGARLLDRSAVTLQEGLHDCGPAALATLLQLAGRRPVPLDSIAELAGTTRAGTSAGGLASAAHDLAFPMRFARLPRTPSPDFGPFIAWVRSSHFVVVRARPDDHVLIHDPQVGRYLLARDRFERMWTGESLVAVSAEPRLTTPSGPDSSARVIATGRLP